MSRNFVHAGKRIRVLATTAHSAGHLVYERGFFGVAQDDVAAGDYFTLILESVWELTNKLSTDAWAMGTKVYASATAGATSIALTPGAPGPASAATGAIAIGRAIATANATAVKVQLFNPNNY